MKLQEAEQRIRISLREMYGASEAGAIASLVMERLTGLTATQRRVLPDQELQQEEDFLLYLGRLLRHEPVQYVLQEAWFHGLKLFVDSRVLIPRPETEELVDWVAQDLRQGAGRSGGQLLDICTGSGCIALALQQQFPQFEVSGCDFSPGALAVARRNASILNLPVSFFECDILNPANILSAGERYAAIVSNPPYISREEQESLAPHVRDYEPHIALFADDADPLIFYRQIGRFSFPHLKPGGQLYVEVHEQRAEEVAEVLQDFQFQDIHIRQDLQGKPRMVRGSKGD